MKLENQVCTLEQAKRLKELGVTQKSLNYFDTSITDSMAPIIGVGNEPLEEYNVTKHDFSAFTVAELGVMLPNKHQLSSPTAWNEEYRKWICGTIYTYDDDWDWKLNQYGHTEAEARAAMLIYLLEGNLTTAADCNARLLQ